MSLCQRRKQWGTKCLLPHTRQKNIGFNEESILNKVPCKFTSAMLLIIRPRMNNLLPKLFKRFIDAVVVVQKKDLQDRQFALLEINEIDHWKLKVLLIGLRDCDTFWYDVGHRLCYSNNLQEIVLNFKPELLVKWNIELFLNDFHEKSLSFKSSLQVLELFEYLLCCWDELMDTNLWGIKKRHNELIVLIV